MTIIFGVKLEESTKKNVAAIAMSTTSIASLASHTIYRLVPARTEGSGQCAHTFGDFPHDSWGTVFPSLLLVGSCGFFKLS